MSGHSHWSTIKHKKASADAKRGKSWSKVARMIIMAARKGGGDPSANVSLRYAIDKAKAVNMPCVFRLAITPQNGKPLSGMGYYPFANS